jgi:hypothetical protein
MADKGILIESSGPLKQNIFGHAEKIFGGTTSNLTIGNSNTVVVGNSNTVVAGAETVWKFLGQFILNFAYKLQCDFGKQKNYYCLTKEEYGTINKIAVGKKQEINSQRTNIMQQLRAVVGETNTQSSSSTLTSSSSTETIGNSRQSIQSRVGTLEADILQIKNRTETIGNLLTKAESKTVQINTIKQLANQITLLCDNVQII